MDGLKFYEIPFNVFFQVCFVRQKRWNVVVSPVIMEPCVWNKSTVTSVSVLLGSQVNLTLYVHFELVYTVKSSTFF